MRNLSNLEFVGDADTNLGEINWVQPKNRTLIWQIGNADRRASEFKLGNLPRQYGLTYQVPADLTYIVGTSKDAEDWYYAQTSRGTWDVKFDLKNPSNDGILTIAIASVARGLVVNVLVNGTNVGTLDYQDTTDNDATTYRSVNSAGRYRREEIKIPSLLLKSGKNTVTFYLNKVHDKGGIMYDTIKFETIVTEK